MGSSILSALVQIELANQGPKFMLPGNKVSVNWGTIHKLMNQPENLNAQCNICRSYYIDQPGGGDRH